MRSPDKTDVVGEAVSPCPHAEFNSLRDRRDGKMPKSDDLRRAILWRMDHVQASADEGL
jgi:hypothetical protein